MSIQNRHEEQPCLLSLYVGEAYGSTGKRVQWSSFLGSTEYLPVILRDLRDIGKQNGRGSWTAPAVNVDILPVESLHQARVPSNIQSARCGTAELDATACAEPAILRHRQPTMCLLQ